MNKFNIGDKVKVINYGSLMFINKSNYKEESKFFNQLGAKLEWSLLTGETLSEDRLSKIEGEDKPKNILSETDIYWTCDSNPELIGQKGVVTKVGGFQGQENYIYQYSIEGIGAWYNESQLELI